MSSNTAPSVTVPNSTQRTRRATATASRCRLEDRLDAQNWLVHGIDLARSQYGNKATYRHVIWRLLEDAIETVENVPDQEMRWLKSGFRSGGWANIVNTKWDVELVERLRVMSAMKLTDEGSPRIQPQRSDLERALGVMSWLRFLTMGRRPEILQKAAVVLARQGDVEEVHRLYAPHTKKSRQTVFEIRNRTIDAILVGLSQTYGLVPNKPSTDLGFREAPRVLGT